MSRKTGGQPGNGNGLRHGVHRLRKQLSVRGVGAIDRRTLAGKAVWRYREDLVVALGGWDELSPQVRALIDELTVFELLCRHGDEYLVSLESPLRGRAGAKVFVPLVRERLALSKRKSELIQLLGLERRPRPIKSLAERIAEFDAKKAPAPGVDTSAIESAGGHPGNAGEGEVSVSPLLPSPAGLEKARS